MNKLYIAGAAIGGLALLELAQPSAATHAPSTEGKSWLDIASGALWFKPDKSSNAAQIDADARAAGWGPFLDDGKGKTAIDDVTDFASYPVRKLGQVAGDWISNHLLELGIVAGAAVLVVIVAEKVSSKVPL
jgi:hypothetical protein